MVNFKVVRISSCLSASNYLETLPRSNLSLESWFLRTEENPEQNLSEQRKKPTTNSTHIWHQHQTTKPPAIWWEASAYPSLATSQSHELTAEKLQSKRSEVFRQRSGPASKEIVSTILNARKDFLESLCQPCYPKFMLLRGRIKKLPHQLYGNIMESF